MLSHQLYTLEYSTHYYWCKFICKWTYTKCHLWLLYLLVVEWCLFRWMFWLARSRMIFMFWLRFMFMFRFRLIKLWTSKRRIRWSHTTKFNIYLWYLSFLRFLNWCFFLIKIKKFRFKLFLTIIAFLLPKKLTFLWSTLLFPTLSLSIFFLMRSHLKRWWFFWWWFRWIILTKLILIFLNLWIISFNLCQLVFYWFKIC